MKFNPFQKSAPLSDKHAFIVLSILMCFSSAQVSLNTYIDSLFITEAISQTASWSAIVGETNPDTIVGALYTFASLLTLLIFFTLPRLLRRFGNYRWTMGIMFGQILSLLGLGLFDSAWLIVPLFITQSALVSILYFNFDIFVERYSKDESTGVIHGVIKALTSLAWLLPPFIAGVIVERYGFSLVYLSGAVLLIPAIFIMMRYLSDFKDMTYQEGPLLFPIKEQKSHPDILRIYWVNFFLQFFYAWMIIYGPIYFINTLGIGNEDFGIIMTIALTAFVIFPFPEGLLADRIIGEKEMLIAGFILMAVSSFAIPYFSDSRMTLWLWGALLFVGRMGASTVETMSDVYFFKQIDGGDASLIGYYRRARPFAYVIAPLLASVLLSYEMITLSGLFTILGCVMLLALYFPLRLKDTR